MGLARSAVCPHSGPRAFLCSIFAGFSLPCLLATAILDSFSLFYLPNNVNQWFVGLGPELPGGSEESVASGLVVH